MERKASSGTGFERKASSSTGFARKLSLPRTLTSDFFRSITVDLMSEEAWTRDMILKTREVHNSGPVGNLPTDTGFEKEEFWYLSLVAIFLGGLLAFVALGFQNFTQEIPKLWQRNGNWDDPTDGDFYSGDLYWIAVPVVVGFIVGFIRWAGGVSDDLPGFFAELQHCHVDYKWMPFVYTLSALSLAGGASLGPEQALANVGGGIATYLSEAPWSIGPWKEGMSKKNKHADNKKILVLCGITAAMGGLFPSAALAVLLVIELASPPLKFMEHTIILSMGALGGFVTYYGVQNETYLEHPDQKYYFAIDWQFELWNCGTGFIVGLVCGCLGIAMLLSIGISKQVFARLRMRFDQIGLSGTMCAPVVGGLMLGLLGWAIPLTICPSEVASKFVLQYGLKYETPEYDTITYDITTTEPSLSQHLLICSLFGKIAAIGISMNCGFIGGFIFPTIVVRTRSHLHSSCASPASFPSFPLYLHISCMYVSVFCMRSLSFSLSSFN
jgi:H+/Cl- antiporter ClcA